MYVTRVPNRSSPPAVLLRESYRDGGKVKTRTLANLTDWPDAKVEALRRVLKGETAIVFRDELRIERSLPHGHVAAVLGLARKLGLHKLLPPSPPRLAKLALAMIVARVIEPAAKLATARQLSEATAAHSLGTVLELGAVDEDELYAALDLLGEAQPKIEQALAKRHLRDGCLVLYDLTSSYLEGRHCELGRFGYSRDGQRDKLQIVFGLLCAADGCPVAVEVFEGNTGDPSTLAVQVTKLKERFGLSRVVLVGDRGMVTEARIEKDLAPAGLDWLTALRAPAIQALAADDGPLQLSLFDERDMAEIASPDYPGERLIV
ncbi:MAG: IS1634 family transposase, partial [Rhodomicrobium sp.]